MIPAIAKVLTLGSVMLGIASAADAQTKVDIGKRHYDTSCAVCHGTSGKGDGPYKSLITKPPSDLTTLAKRNNGVFPVSRIYEVIDGRAQVAVHGPREMPIWGSGDFLNPMPGGADPLTKEVMVRVWILALIDYIARIQTK